MKNIIKKSGYKTPLSTSFIKGKIEELLLYPRDHYIKLRDVPLDLPLTVGEIIEGLKKIILFKKSGFRPASLGLKKTPHEISTIKLINLFSALNLQGSDVENFIFIYTNTDVENAHEMGKLLEHFVEVKRHIELIKTYKVGSTSNEKSHSLPLDGKNHIEVLQFCLSYLKEHKKHLIEKGSAPLKDKLLQKGCFCFKNLLEGKTFGRVSIRKALIEYKIDLYEKLLSSIDQNSLSPFTEFFESMEVPEYVGALTFKKLMDLEEDHLKYKILKEDQDYNLYCDFGPYREYLNEPIVGGILGTLEFIYYIFEAHLLKKDPSTNRKELLELFCFYTSRKIGFRYRLTENLVRETLLNKSGNHYLPELGYVYVKGERHTLSNRYLKTAIEILLEAKERSDGWTPLKSLTKGEVHDIETQIMPSGMLYRETVKGVRQKSTLWDQIIETKKVGRNVHVRLVG